MAADPVIQFETWGSGSGPDASDGGDPGVRGLTWERWGEASAPPSMAADIAKSGGIGLAKGVIGLAGLPGDVSSWMGGNFLPTSAGIQKKIEGVTGQFYEPKTTAGQYAQTIGEFAPAALGGPETLGARLLRVLGPAVASETAGQATKGTALEPAARVVGALAGGRVGVAPARLAAAPSLEDIATAKQADYQAVRDLGVTFKPQAVKRMVGDIRNDLEQQGITADVADVTHKTLDRLEARNTPSTITDIDNTRKVLGQLAKGSTSPNTMERINAGAAQQAIRAVDEALPQFQPADFATGTANHAKAIEHLTNARGNAAVEFQARALDRAEYRAANNAAAANSGTNYENALRQQLKSILNNPARANQFAPSLRAEMQKIVRGEGTRNMIRFVGNLLGGGGGIGAIGTAAAGHMALPGLGAFAPVVGYGIKKIGNAITERAVNRLNEQVRAASPLGQAQTAAMSRPRPRLTPLQRRLMASALALPGAQALARQPDYPR